MSMLRMLESCDDVSMRCVSIFGVFLSLQKLSSLWCTRLQKLSAHLVHSVNLFIFIMPSDENCVG